MKISFTLFFLVSCGVLFGQSPETFTSSTTWTCPAGVTSVDIECWGAGGGGGASDAAGSTSFKGGGGGGGGSYVKKSSVVVVPGTVYTITVGTGGAAGTDGKLSGIPGGKSEFSGGAVTTITASGGTPGTGGNTQRATGVGGVLGGVYLYTLGSGGTSFYTTATTTFTYTGGGGVSAGATPAIVGGATGAIQFIVPTGMGSGYTSVPTVTINSTNSPTAGSGATVTASVNPNINSSGATTTTLGGNGTGGTSPSNTRGTGTGTWASGSMTVTFTVALANSTNLVGAYITGTGIPVGTKVTAFSGLTVGSTLTLDANTTAAATATSFTLFKLTGTAGGAGGNGGNGGTGGLATANTFNATFAVGNAGTAPGGGGSGAISEAGTQSGGAGAVGQVTLSYTVLAVELTTLKARNNGKTNLVTWTTASEKDNASFIVERSANGQDFVVVGTVKGNGTSTVENGYNFSDETPLSTSYYRVKSVDFNGATVASKVVSVSRDKGLSLKVYPSVVSDVLTVEIGSTEKATLTIRDITGRTITTQQATETTQINTSTLPKGLYILTVEATGFKASERFVKQ